MAFSSEGGGGAAGAGGTPPSIANPATATTPDTSNDDIPLENSQASFAPLISNDAPAQPKDARNSLKSGVVAVSGAPANSSSPFPNNEKQRYSCVDAGDRPATTPGAVAVSGPLPSFSRKGRGPRRSDAGEAPAASLTSDNEESSLAVQAGMYYYVQ
jgi:hypothetical protein